MINLVLGIDTGDGCQGGFEGTEQFGWPFRDIDHECDTAETPLDPASLPH